MRNLPDSVNGLGEASLELFPESILLIASGASERPRSAMPGERGEERRLWALVLERGC